MSKNQGRKTSIFSKIIIISVLLVMIPIIIALTKETYKKNQIQKEIEGLQEKAKQIDKENTDIQEQISYLGSKDYQEKEAKDKLNLQNPGENIVVIKPSITKKDQVEEKKAENVIMEEKKVINPIKWWHYFFKN
ncbi:MAG TPA: septum formation initiator family protein [Patescibacteria group bacterium]